MKRRTLLVAAASSLLGSPAFALMAGSAPDSPMLRLDPNRSDSRYACVASLMGDGSTYSAVCIAPSFALSAAHAVPRPQDQRLCLNFGSDLSHRFAIRKVSTPPVPAKRDPRWPVGDLALIEIDGRFPEALALPALARTPAQEGIRIELAGYGASGFGDRGVTVDRNPMLKRSGANRIDRVLRSEDVSATPLLYFFTFGANRNSKNALGNRIETGLANGDSGSPAFVEENGRLAVLGINTFVMRTAGAPVNGFGTVGGGQVLAAHRAWLLSVLGPNTWAGLD